MESAMDPKLLSGTLETMMLEVLSHAPSYGYEIVQTVLARSGGRFALKEGSLYPALHKLEAKSCSNRIGPNSTDGGASITG